MVTVTKRVDTTLKDVATMVEIAARRLVRMVTLRAAKLDMTATASRPQSSELMFRTREVLGPGSKSGMTPHGQWRCLSGR